MRDQLSGKWRQMRNRLSDDEARQRYGREITNGWTGARTDIAQGPIMLMFENYRTVMLWQLMRKCPYLVSGLRRAEFTGGWVRGAL